jgi:hypothetical protein
MAAPLSTPSGVVKPSDKENDSSSHDGMYADTASNHIDGVGGHYEYQDVWVVDRIETLTKTIPAVYETKVGYLPARTETRYEIIPEWFEKVVIPKQVEHKKVWVPEKVTYIPKTIPAKTGYRTVVVKPAHMIYGTKTIPGYWVNGKKYIPPKTIRTRVKKGRGYRYITRTIPGKWVPTRRWVGPRQVPDNTWVPAQTRREKYVIEPAKKTMEKVVLKKGYFREYDVTVKEAETKYIHHDEVKRPYQVQIPPEKVETKVLVKEAYPVTEKREIGHFETKYVWVSGEANLENNGKTVEIPHTFSNNTSEKVLKTITKIIKRIGEEVVEVAGELTEEIFDTELLENLSEYDVLLQNIKFYQSEDGTNWIEFFGKKFTDKQITRATADLIIQNKYAQAFSQLDDSQVNTAQKGFIKIIFFLAGFLQDEHKVWHTYKNCWQQIGGYNDFYDTVFDYATNMMKDKFKVIVDDIEYILWAWKGDYLNLGAGAELGIYKRTVGEDDNETDEMYHYRVDKGLSMKMTLKLEDHKTNKEIINFEPNKELWWVTGFHPYAIDRKPEELTATYTVDFSKRPDLYNAFYQKYHIDREDTRWEFIKETSKAIFRF